MTQAHLKWLESLFSKLEMTQVHFSFWKHSVTRKWLRLKSVTQVTNSFTTLDLLTWCACCISCALLFLQTQLFVSCDEGVVSLSKLSTSTWWLKRSLGSTMLWWCMSLGGTISWQPDIIWNWRSCLKKTIFKRNERINGKIGTKFNSVSHNTYHRST